MQEDNNHLDSPDDDKSITPQEISSTSELEELVSPTVAPATPSYDAEPSTTINTASSSIVSHPQENNYVLSSVILIAPSDPGHIQSSQGAQGDQESTYSEAVPTRKPEVLSSVLDSA